MDSWIFSCSVHTDRISSLAGNVWVDMFQFFEFVIIMRQKDDQDFALLLNGTEGKHTDEDLSILKTHCYEHSQIDVTRSPHIFCKKLDASNHNVMLLSKLSENQLVKIDAIDCMSGDLSVALQEKLLSKLPSDPSQTMSLNKQLVLGLGITCDVFLNIDVHDGLTNGASCVVKKNDFRVPHSQRCSIVWVLFDDPAVGVSWRTKYKHLYTSEIDLLWTPIFETTRKFPFRHYRTYLVVRRQFPLVVSAGKTIHKAQGSTMKSAVMHFGNRHVPHLHYVGLSRVSSLSGINILCLNEKKITTSSDAMSAPRKMSYPAVSHA